jgi:predicted TIM-barrel fold metal-dependent hydrolase
VCLLAAAYNKVINALRVAIQDQDQAARDAVLGGTALRVYGLRR